jgi:hypothetical protein
MHSKGVECTPKVGGDDKSKDPKYGGDFSERKSIRDHEEGNGSSFNLVSTERWYLREPSQVERIHWCYSRRLGTSLEFKMSDKGNIDYSKVISMNPEGEEVICA